jgi:phosphatidylserine/phosphatidylglycerophosphate/cardiolipin synthase-like enzyme
MSFNEESILVVLDKGVAQRMENLFLEDLEFAEEIMPAEFAKRPWTARIAEHACHLIWRVL